MKRGVKAGFLIIILLVLSLYFVNAQDNEATQSEKDAIINGSKIKDFGSFTDKEIKIPEGFQNLARVVFGIKGEISVAVFIVLIAVWIGLAIFIHSLVVFMPFFEGNLKSILVTIVITLLIAVSGAIKSIAVFLFNLGNIFGILERWSIFKLTFAIILVIILVYSFSYVTRLLKETATMEKAEIDGIKAAAGKEILKKTAETFSDGGGI